MFSFRFLRVSFFRPRLCGECGMDENPSGGIRKAEGGFLFSPALHGGKEKENGRKPPGTDRFHGSYPAVYGNEMPRNYSSICCISISLA